MNKIYLKSVRIHVLDGFRTEPSVDDAMAARSVIPQIDRLAQPRLRVIWADNKYHNHSLNGHVQSHPLGDWKIEVVKRPPGVKGFVLLPKRWVVSEKSYTCESS